MANPYKKPYMDSDVFIGWIKGEQIPETAPDGTTVIVDRGKIAEHLLTLAEQGTFPIVISGLTFAEVHKLRGKPKLANDENQNVLDYFEHDFVVVVPVDRARGEEANKLCRRYEAEKLSPNDAVHLACAIHAGCDVLLSWDKVLNSINHPGIEIMRPEIWTPIKIPTAVQMPLPTIEGEQESADIQEEVVPPAPTPVEAQADSKEPVVGQDEDVDAGKEPVSAPIADKETEPAKPKPDLLIPLAPTRQFNLIPKEQEESKDKNGE